MILYLFPIVLHNCDLQCFILPINNNNNQFTQFAENSNTPFFPILTHVSHCIGYDGSQNWNDDHSNEKCVDYSHFNNLQLQKALLAQ